MGTVKLMIYLDANSTSRLRSQAIESSDQQLLGNPSSVHSVGRTAKAALNIATSSLQEFLDAKEAELIFTSGGTESCNSLCRGFLNPTDRGIILVSPLDHPAVREPLDEFESIGFNVKTLPLDKQGRVNVEESLQLLSEEVKLVSCILASNESGAVQPVEELASELRSAGYKGPVVTDASQAPGKYPFSAAKLFAAGVDAIAVSAHKHGGPAGVGAMLIGHCDRESCLRFKPTIVGGPQQQRFRAGTENLSAIVAWGQVAKALKVNSVSEIEKISTDRELLWEKIFELTPAVSRLTPETGSLLSNTLQISVEGCRGDDLVVALDLEGLCVSTGSACSSGKQEVSKVALALGMSKEQALGVIRISLDWDFESREIEKIASTFASVVLRMRAVEKKVVGVC